MKVRRKASRNRAAHAARDLVGPHAANALAAQRVGRLDLVGGRSAARAHDQARARAGHLLGRKAGLGNRVFQRDVGVGRRVAHEAQLLAVQPRLQVDQRDTRYLAAQAFFSEIGRGADAGTASAQGGFDRGEVVANTRDDARASDDDATFHDEALSCEATGTAALGSRRNRPTRKSLAT